MDVTFHILDEFDGTGKVGENCIRKYRFESLLYQGIAMSDSVGVRRLPLVGLPEVS